MEWRKGVRSECFLVSIVSELITNSESTNQIMDGRRHTSRDLGFLAEPHVCQGTLSILHKALLTTPQLFNASHMAPYDVPDVAHDMILRFMGMDFSAIVDGSARIPSAVGDDAKPIFMDSGDVPLSSPLPGKTPEQTKAQWDGNNFFLHTGKSADSVFLSAYYNAGSVVLIFLLLAIAVGLCIWCRLRRRPVRLMKNPQSEENIPLNGYDDEQAYRKRKGKERALENESGTAIFDVGEDEEEYASDDMRKGRID